MASNLGQLCPKCGRSLPARAAEGLCRHCLAGSLLGPEIEPAPPLEEGFPRRFGDYELIDEIGRGGMGVIYRARQLGLNRPVALKFVARWSGSGDFLERFEIEAKASASLNHPHIVPIFEFGDHDGQPFLSMRPLHESLDRKIARERLDLKSAAELVIKVARAAHFAHQRGIIHRDIKPSNILLDEAGEPFLADFGLAKLVERDSALTMTRAMLGTPSYISPEQAQGKTSEVTTAADVYSLGAVLYELITGQPPFAGGTTLDTVRQVIEKEPRTPASLNPKVSPDLDTICLHCLEKKPQKRYASAEALAEDLERWTKWLPIQARPISTWERTGKWIRRHPAWTVAIFVTVSALLAVAIVSTVARQKLTVMGEERRAQLVRLNLAAAERLVERRDISGALHWHLQALRLEQDPTELDVERYATGALLRDAPRVEAMFFHTGPVNFAIFSPDGRRVVTASDDFTACIWDAASGKRLTDPLPHNGKVHYAVFSPDGKWLATCAEDGTARIWETANGRPVSEVRYSSRRRRPTCISADFRKDGLAIVTRFNFTARIWDVQTGAVMGQPFQHDEAVTQAMFSPDGRSVLTASSDGTARIWNASDATSARVTLRPGGVVEGATFNADGTLVATFADWGGIQIWDAVTGQQVGRTLTHESKRLWSQCVFSPDGKTILTADQDNLLKLWDVGTGQRVWEMTVDVGISMAAFSPDGKRVVVAGLDMAARVLDAANGTMAWPVLRHGSLLFSVAFDAAGERVVTAAENGVAQVWQWSREQSSTFVASYRGVIQTAGADPRGRRLVMSGARGTKTWDVPGGKLIHEDGERPMVHAVLSEDAEKLATVTTNGLVRFWPMLASGAGMMEMTNHSIGTAWQVVLNRDSSRLLVLGERGTTLWEPAKGRQIGDPINPGHDPRYGKFSADGGRFIIGRYGGALPQPGAAANSLVGFTGAYETMQVYESEEAKPVGKPVRQFGIVFCADLSRDGKRLVTGSVLGYSPPMGAWVWDMEAGRMVAGPLPHRDGVHLVAFSPDAQSVATAGGDAALRIWDAATGVPRTPPIAQSSKAAALAFSPDGRMFASGNLDGVARVWSARTGRPLTPALLHATRVMLVQFLPEKEGLLTVSGDGLARIWRLGPNEDPIERLTARAEILSSHRFDSEAGLVPLDREALFKLWSHLHPQ